MFVRKLNTQIESKIAGKINFSCYYKIVLSIKSNLYEFKKRFS